jgi:hypothetical protein
MTKGSPRFFLLFSLSLGLVDVAKESIIVKTSSENLPPAFAEAPVRRTRLWKAGLRAGRQPLFAKEGDICPSKYGLINNKHW